MLDPSSIYKHQVFRSDQRSETHALVTREFADHRLCWHGDVVDTRFYKSSTSRLSLYSLRYGPAVSIFPETYRDFSLVHFSLRGGISIDADGYRHDVRPGRAMISSPTTKINLWWSGGCEQIILRVPHEALQEAALAIGRLHLYRQTRERAGLLLSDHASRLWECQIQTLMALEHRASDDSSLSPWLAHMERSIAMFLLLQGSEEPYRERNINERPLSSRQSNEWLDRLLSYANANLTSPVTLRDLSRAAAVSDRQLNTLCQEILGMPPMAWLRVRRLHAVRRMLHENPSTDIATAAMSYGFFNLGRFAAYYKDEFGEFPSETLRFARSG